MKLEHLNEAVAAVQRAVNVPFETRMRHGLIHAENVVRCIQAAAMTATSARVAGTLDDAMRDAILDQIWDDLVSPI